MYRDCDSGYARLYQRENLAAFCAHPPYPPYPHGQFFFLVEGDTHFQAGNLDAAIDSYNKAILLEPENVDVRVNLARIQVYSSASLTTDQERRDRLADALAVVDEARELAPPQNADALAVRSFVLNWSANPPALAGDRTKELRNAAEADALAAIQLDSSNALAKAYYAEVLIDQFKWGGQAQDYIAQARENGGEHLMDVRRVQAFVYEVLQEYNLAIDWYQKRLISTRISHFCISAWARFTATWVVMSTLKPLWNTSPKPPTSTRSSASKTPPSPPIWPSPTPTFAWVKP